MSHLGESFDASARQATREKRQELGHQAVMALFSILKNARVYSEDNAVFQVPVDQMQEAIVALLASDGLFELKLADEGLYVNRQVVRFEASLSAAVGALKTELDTRGLQGFTAQIPPGKDELRHLVRVFTPSAPKRPGPKGDPSKPLSSISLVLEKAADEETGQQASVQERLVNAYSYAVFFVSRYIEQLRAGGEVIQIWAASRVVQDLVDLQRQAPVAFLQLAHCKAGAEAYWGYHAANVAVLSITFGGRLGLPKRRQHDLGMAALFHDVGMAALPPAILHKADALDARERYAVDASPLFAARAILRDRDVHQAALDRALAAYECHLDLAPQSGDAQEVGFPGRVLAISEAFDALTTTRPFRAAHRPEQALQIMQTELGHRFDADLLALVPQAFDALF